MYWEDGDDDVDDDDDDDADHDDDDEDDGDEEGFLTTAFTLAVSCWTHVNLIMMMMKILTIMMMILRILFLMKKLSDSVSSESTIKNIPDSMIAMGETKLSIHPHVPLPIPIL